MDKRCFLFVLDRGFVVVGMAEPDPEFAFHWLVRGRTVRRWGTTDGLAELQNGPRPQTTLDPVVIRHIPWRSIIEIQEVNQDSWVSYLE